MILQFLPLVLEQYRVHAVVGSLAFCALHDIKQ